MVRAHVSIGTNIERERHVRAALTELERLFGALTVSTVYESAPVGFEGDPFFNLVAAFETTLPAPVLVQELRKIEDRNHRDRLAPRMGSRTLDIDLLLYGDLVLRQPGLELPRQEITRHAFVLRPLAEVAGDKRHPLTGQRFAELWSGFDASDQPTWPAECPLNEVRG